jgi:hypothetical protein
MGIYVNPGKENFETAVNSRIYVDKTGLLEYTNSVLGTEQKCMCVSRPRRFGKSLDVKVVVSKNLFFCCGMIIHFGCQILLCT